MKKKTKEICLILHNLRSVYNVGSIFRTADTCGISKIYLTGYTPTPKDRFGNLRGDLSKVALGAEKNIPWEKHRYVSEAIKKLKKEGSYIVSVEQSKNSKDYKNFKAQNKTTYIFGNEVRGLTPSILQMSDTVLEIPMRGNLARHRIADGGKESLNVSVSAGIVLFRTLNI